MRSNDEVWFGDINAWLIVKVPGYETRRLQLSVNLKTSRELTRPVRLRIIDKIAPDVGEA